MPAVRGLQVLTVVAALLVGIASGVGGYTFIYARGYSYLLNDPAACANCHVMQEQLDGWRHSSHRSVATCNDCHTPHDVLGKYATKVRNGFWHSFYFTSGRFHEPIHILARDRAITEAACLSCHEPLVSGMATPSHGSADRLSCVRCHSGVGHMEFGAVSYPFPE